MSRPDVRLARLVVPFVLAISGLTVGGCTAVRNGLGTRTNECFSVLPTARRVVGPSMSLAGVRYLTPQSLVSSLERATGHAVVIPARLNAVRTKSACLVAYMGGVPDALLDSAWQPEPGPTRFTVVLVRQSDHQVLGVVVLPRPPFRFGRFS